MYQNTCLYRHTSVLIKLAFISNFSTFFLRFSDEDDDDEQAPDTPKAPDLTEALANLTEHFPQFDGGYDLRRKKGKSNPEKASGDKDLQWFRKSQPPPDLKELRIPIKKVKLEQNAVKEENTPVKTATEKNILDDENLTEKLVALLSPIAGPSGLQSPKSDYQTPKKCQQSDESSEDDDSLIQSFYDRTLVFDEPLSVSDDSDSERVATDPLTQALDTTLEEKITICPKQAPPTPDDVQKCLQQFYEARKPVYKDFNDVTKKREVGYNVLHVQGDCLKACPAFESDALEMKSKGSILTEVRREVYKSLTGESVPNVEQINEYLLSDQSVILDSSKKPPTSIDARHWVRKRQLLAKSDKDIDRVRKIEDDSPAKIKVEKPVNAILLDADGSPDASQTVIENSVSSMASGDMKKETFQFNVSSTSPLTLLSDVEKRNSPDATPNTSRGNISRRRRKRGLLSLSKKLQIRQALAASPAETKIDHSPNPSQASQSSIQSNETVSENSSASVRLNPFPCRKYLTNFYF